MTNEERVKGLRRHVARGRRDRGQSLIEFALVLPMLLVLFFGIIEFGNAWRIYQPANVAWVEAISNFWWRLEPSSDPVASSSRC